MLYAAIDMGGTKTAAALVQNGVIIASDTFSTRPERGLAAISSDCALFLARMLEKQGKTASDIVSVGVSAPGIVDEKGIMTFSPVTGWKNADIAGAVESALGISAPSAVDNDVNACALAEAAAGDTRDMLWITVSTGIGGAVVIGGKVYAGTKRAAGEIGHLKVEFSAPRLCACGQYGCVEAYSSGTAVGKTAAALAEADKEYEKLYAAHGLDVTAKSCAVLARSGDGSSLRIFAEAGKYLGRALSAAQNLLDCGVIYIGGGMAASLDLMLPAIKTAFTECAIPSAASVEILPSRLGYDAALKGAAALAVQAKNNY